MTPPGHSLGSFLTLEAPVDLLLDHWGPLFGSCGPPPGPLGTSFWLLWTTPGPPEGSLDPSWASLGSLWVPSASQVGSLNAQSDENISFYEVFERSKKAAG